MKITPEFIYAIAPSARPEYVAAMVASQSLLEKYGITSIADVSHFLGQCAAETMAFNRLEESLYYTSTARLRAVWPSRFKTDAAAAPYVRHPEKLANLVYGKRGGNISPGDGWAFRGSGLPHLTFRSNYQMVQDHAGLDCVAQPELIRAFPAALEAACVFWKVNKLAKLVGDVKSLTKAWQGGSGALADRIAFTKRALTAAIISVGAGLPDAPIIPVKEHPMVPIPASQLMRNGDRGAGVKALQVRLDAGGYEVGKIDGIYGDATERAVRDFQAASGLIADGVAGPATMKALAAPKATQQAKPLPQQSGLNRFLAWLISLFNPR